MQKIVLVGNLGRPFDKKAVAPRETTAKVTMDRYAPLRDSGIVEADGASNPPAFSEAKAYATLQARFELHGWQLDPDPGIDGRMRFILTRSRCVRTFKNLDDIETFLRHIDPSREHRIDCFTAAHERAIAQNDRTLANCYRNAFARAKNLHVPDQGCLPFATVAKGCS